MRKFLLILILSLFSSGAIFAQVTTGSITGTIKDAKGEALPGAPGVSMQLITPSHFRLHTKYRIFHYWSSS